MTVTVTRVGVVGAGAVGLTAALDLARAGVEVHVFDRGRVGDGESASARAAGLCYDAHAGETDARVAARALERLRELGDDSDIGRRDCPYVWLAREGDQRRARAIRDQVPRMRDHGRRVELLSGDDLAETVPSVRTDDVAVAAVARDACRVDPAAYLERVADLAETAGAVVHESTPVELDVDAGEPTLSGVGRTNPAPSVDAVVVAAGAHTARLLERAGIPVPLVPYRVQALVASVDEENSRETDGNTRATPVDDTARTDGEGPYAADAQATRTAAHAGPMVYDATGGFYCRPHPAGVLAGDGTEERAADPVDYRQAPDAEFPADLCERVAWRLDTSVRLERAWAGLCTATPDRDPLLGRVAGGVHVAAGWQGSGFMRAPATGAAVAEGLLSGETAPIEAYDPSRFDGDESVDVREGMVVD